MPGCDACAVRTRADCAERPGTPRETGTSTVRGASAHLRQVRLALPHTPVFPPRRPYSGRPRPPARQPPCSPPSGKLWFETRQRTRRWVAWGPPCRPRRLWGPRHPTAPQALVHRKRPEGCELPRGLLPFLRFEFICKSASAFELSSEAEGRTPHRFPHGAQALLPDPEPQAPAATELHCSSGH